MPIRTVYFHADCLDGFGAAYAAWRAFGDAARYRPMHHGMSWDAADVDGAEVWVLDYSFPPAQLYAMTELAAAVVQIDHHASARDQWADVLREDGASALAHRDSARRLGVYFDMTRSGAVLAWEHLHPGEAVPLALRHVEDQDLWRFALPDSRAFCAALRLRPFAFADWDAVVRASERPDDPAIARLVADGRAIVAFMTVEIGRLADSPLVGPIVLPLPVDGGAPREIAGLAINASALFASELGHRLAERSGSFAVVWQIGADGLVKAGLRACGEVDVAAIASHFGGGGHPNAAGFRLPVARFMPLLRGDR